MEMCLYNRYQVPKKSVLKKKTTYIHFINFERGNKGLREYNKRLVVRANAYMELEFQDMINPMNDSIWT
jgi:hypothetical protein